MHSILSLQNLRLGGLCILMGFTISACEVSAGLAPISGFKPIYPPQHWDVGIIDYGDKQPFMFWEEIDSLQPTFRWEPFPGVEQNFRTFDKKTHTYASEPFVKIDPGRVGDVAYDLRVWKFADGRRGKLVYEKDGIENTYHRIEQPLEPDSRYLWTVRARFLLDGKPRLSEWSMTSIPGNFPVRCNQPCQPREAARLLGRIPATNLYHFQTP